MALMFKFLSTMINLIGEQEMGLFIRLCIAPGDDGPSALRLALRTPSAAEWKSHLLMFIQNLQVSCFQ